MLIQHRYKRGRSLARGIFGEIFEIEDLKNGSRKCLLEQFQPKKTDSEDLEKARDAFYENIHALTKLGKQCSQLPLISPGFEETHGFEENQKFYIVRELIDGTELTYEIIKNIQDYRLNETRTIGMLKEVLQLLKFVHQTGFIHQNIRPANLIRRRKNKKIVLVNFGLVEPKNLHLFEVTPSVEGYTPHDQEHNPSFSSDVYAVGMIGLQFCTGLTIEQLQRRNSLGEVLIPLKTPISPDLAFFLGKMVCQNHEQRYSSASEALEALQKLIYHRNIRSIKSFFMLGCVFLAGTGMLTGLSIGSYRDNTQRTQTTPSPAVSLEPLDDFITFYQDQYKIKMLYPKTWNVKKWGFNELPKSKIFDRTIAKFKFTSTQDALENSLEEVNLIIEDWSDVSNALIKYNQQREKDLKELSLNCCNFSSIPSSNYSAYETYIQHIGTDEQNGKKLSSFERWMLRDGKIYVFTYTTDLTNYDKSLDKIKKIVDSFQIVDESSLKR